LHRKLFREREYALKQQRSYFQKLWTAATG